MEMEAKITLTLSVNVEVIKEKEDMSEAVKKALNAVEGLEVMNVDSLMEEAEIYGSAILKGEFISDRVYEYEGLRLRKAHDTEYGCFLEVKNMDDEIIDSLYGKVLPDPEDYDDMISFEAYIENYGRENGFI